MVSFKATNEAHMKWTHGFVGFCSVLVCAATALAGAPDVSCERPQRGFVVRPLNDDDAHLVLVSPQRLSMANVEPVGSLRVVMSFLEQERSSWRSLKDMVFATRPTSILDVAVSAADLARAIANNRPRSRAIEVSLQGLDGSLSTLSANWGELDVAEPTRTSGFRLWSLATGCDVWVTLLL